MEVESARSIEMESTTLPKTNIAPKDFLFQGSIFMGYVSFREGKSLSDRVVKGGVQGEGVLYYSLMFPKVPQSYWFNGERFLVFSPILQT